MFQELDYTQHIEKVKGVRFSIMSPEEIERRSVAEVYTNETYDGDIPKVGGIFDPRMGVLEHGKKCPTDELDNRYCPGYFGHVELAKPVFHIHMLKYVIKTLQVVCPKCSKLFIDPNSPELRKIINSRKGAARFAAVTSLCSKYNNRICGQKNEDGCSAHLPSIIKKEPTSIGKLTAVWKISNKSKDGEKKAEDISVLWDAGDVSKILRRISDKDLEALGFNVNYCKPDWLICSILPVAPPYVRPSVRADNNTRMEDDLTHKYCDIIKTNKTLKAKLSNNHPKKAIDEWYQLLQYHVATLVNNQLPGIPPAQQRSGRPLKAINDRLKSKEGRVRGNLMGKRVDFSARSVITPDPRLSIDQLGVPIDICKNLTFPEKVNKFNIDRLLKLVKNGYHTYPGAKSIKRVNDKKIISLSVIDRSKIVLQYGDIVNRHLIYDDIVLFNRQPSLHKMSMMQHRVVPLPYKTFRLNVSVTTPYNADFDGDEMNMHVPQSEQSRIEINVLASVSTQIVSPADNRPIISLVQDTCVGSYLLTRYDNYLSENDVRNILIDINKFQGRLPEPELKIGNETPEHFPLHKYNNFVVSNDSNNTNIITTNLWSGRQLFEMVIPNVTFRKKNKSYSSDKSPNNEVNIQRGLIKSGVFDKNILGRSEQGLIHIIYNDYGPDRTKQFLDDIQNIVTNFILKSGFSVGISDLIPDYQTKLKMKDKIKKAKKNVIELIEHTHKGILEQKGGRNISEEFESQILGQLNRLTHDTGEIALKSLDNSNRMLNMIRSGSKGSEINMGQMIACVGQQVVDGKRIPLGFTDRTLPHFHKYDDGSSARGFVENSFMNGLTPTEFFFHAMGGREGLIDTAVKTSETGYIQRKLIKGLEDARIVADMTVRNANGSILQFIYGEDGFDGCKIEKQAFSTLGTNGTLLKGNKYIFDNYYFSIDQLKNILEINMFNQIHENRDKFEIKIKKYVQNLIDDRNYYYENFFIGSISNDVYYPINIKRLLENTTKQFTSATITDLNPIYIIDTIDNLTNELRINSTYKSSELLTALCRIYFNPKQLLNIEYKSNSHRMTKTAFDYMITHIRSQFYESIAVSGELVGTIAAQSIGEPSTQMTLNTFHFAGVASKSSVNQGVPRFKELLNVTENLKAPMLTIVLDEPHCFNKESALSILNDIPITTIKELTKSSEITFDIDSSSKYVSKDEIHNDMLQIYSKFSKLNFVEKDVSYVRSPWVLKLEFSKSKLMLKQIQMSDIYFAIINKFNSDSNDISCFYTDDNSPNLIMRIQTNIRFNPDEDTAPLSNQGCDEEDVISVLKTLEKTILNDIILSGIKDITGASMEPQEGYITYDSEKGEYDKKTLWKIYTDGTNLEDIMTHPNVNPYETVSNNIWEVYRLLGIEAARKMLFDEINSVFSMSSAYVNARHINLLVDMMTQKGSLMPMDRHGINKSDRGPLAKSSFEETPDIIAKAAIFGELDNVQSVSANIMLGQEVPIGTGSIDVLFDEDKFYDTVQNEDIGVDEPEELDTEETRFTQEYCDNLF